MTEAPTITKPALLVHVFLDADAAATPGAPAEGCLTSLWTATHTALELTDGVAGTSGDLDIAALSAPSAGFTLRTDVLGMRENPATHGIEQAAAFRHHDVVGVSVMLAPSSASWQQLSQRWRDATSEVPLAAALGTAELHIGLVPDLPADPTDLADALRTQVPEPHDGHWPPCWSASRRRGTTLWELPWRDPVSVPTDRRFLALAPQDRETELDRWLWTDGTPLVAPLTRHLLHAAKIRHLHRVLTADLPRLRDFGRQLDEESGNVQHAAASLTGRPAATVGRPRTTRPEQLRAAETGLTRIAAMTTEFAHSHAQLDAAVEAIRFAATNARAATRDVRSEPGAPIADDARLAAVSAEQAEAESRALRALAEEANRATELADRTIDTLLRDRQAQLSLAQTAVIGALLMVLAAVQALDYKLPVPGPIQAPLIAVLGSLALALPLALPRWRLGAADRAGPPGILVDATVGCVGAATGWLAASLAATIGLQAAAPVWWSLTAAAAGALVTTGISLVRGRRTAPSPTP